MVFPESHRIEFKNNPLDRVICQLRFPTILTISASEPDKFQEDIRSTYPYYERKPNQLIPPEVIAAAPQLREVRDIFESGAPVHEFTAADNTRAVSLNQDFVALTENNYSDWKKFFCELDHILKALEKYYTPSFYTRIGLRYVDVIDRKKLELENTPWKELIVSEIIGVLGDENLGKSTTLLKEEIIVELTDTIPNAKVRIRHGLLTRNRDPNVYVIDSDFYIEDRSEENDVTRILDKFNDMAGNLFRWSITSKLQDALR